MAADRSDNDVLDEQLRVYFGFATLAEVRAHDFPVREYNAGVVTAGGPGLDSSFNHVYLDNCHCEHYSDRVVWNSPMIGNHSSSTLAGMVLYWWAFYCHTDGADPRCRISGIQVQVQSGAKEKYFVFPDYGGNSWNEDYTWLENTAHANRASNSNRYADRLSISHPYTHYGVNGRDGEAHVMYGTPAAGSFLGFYDNTTSTTGGVPNMVRIGGVGNSVQLRGFQHVFSDRDGNTLFTITANGTLRFNSHPAEPTNQNGDLARSDGTASTNGFGTDGPGLYFKTSGGWSKL